jgi:hypothetical protein
MNLWRITWTYVDRADYTAVENAGYAEWLHERLRSEARHHFTGSRVLTVKAEPVNGGGKGWEWLNPDADDIPSSHGRHNAEALNTYEPAHARNSVDAAAQGV